MTDKLALIEKAKEEKDRYSYIIEGTLYKGGINIEPPSGERPPPPVGQGNTGATGEAEAGVAGHTPVKSQGD